MKIKISILAVLLFGGSMIFAQKNSFEAEVSVNLSMENNVGNYGIIGSTGMNYYFINRIGINTNIGFFQSFIPLTKYNNCSLFKWDADIFFDIIRTANGGGLRASVGASYFKGSTEWGSDLDGNIPIGYDVEFHHNLGANLKLQYRFPVSARFYVAVNGECYYLPGFSTDFVPALGCTVGYKF